MHVHHHDGPKPLGARCHLPCLPADDLNQSRPWLVPVLQQRVPLQLHHLASPSEHQQNTAGCLSADTGRKYEGHLIAHLRPWLRRLVGNEFLRCLRHST